MKVDKALVAALLIATLDMLTTHINMRLYNTCELERNPLLRSMCEEIGYGATWLWLPVEFSALAVVYEGLKMLRSSLGAEIPVEEMFLVLATAPIINNTIMIAEAAKA